jgi:hypothetical protein
MATLLLSSCGFQHRRYTRGHYWGGSIGTMDQTSIENHPLRRKSIDLENPITACLPTHDTLPPLPEEQVSLDTLMDSLKGNDALLNEWEGDRLIHERGDTLHDNNVLLDKKVEHQAKTSLISGYMALFFPVIGVVLPYLLNTLIPNNVWLGLTGFMLYILLQLTAFIAIFVAATTGFKATRYLESLGLQNIHSETYEKARKGKKMALIVMAVRVGMVFLSTLGFLILISRFGN